MAIKEEILKSKTDSSALVKLIERFGPLLNKYAKKLSTEDAYADLQLKFIEMILQFNPNTMRSSDDPYILSYLSRSMHNHYILLSKQKQSNNLVFPISSMGKADEYNVDFFDKLCMPTTDNHMCDEFDFLYKNLTAYEANIVIMVYFYRFTIREVAMHFEVSSSAISQAKSNAIKKLKKMF